MTAEKPSLPRRQFYGGKSGPIYLLACVGLIWWSLIVGRQELEFAGHAQHVSATVIGHRGNGNHGQVSEIRFEFKGETYGQYMTADGKLNEGDEVTVLVNPDDPDRSVVNDNLEIFSKALSLAGMAVFFGILTLIKFPDFLPQNWTTNRM